MNLSLNKEMILPFLGGINFKSQNKQYMEIGSSIFTKFEKLWSAKKMNDVNNIKKKNDSGMALIVFKWQFKTWKTFKIFNEKIENKVVNLFQQACLY